MALPAAGLENPEQTALPLVDEKVNLIPKGTCLINVVRAIYINCRGTHYNTQQRW
jgi:hypothetical protein